MTQRLAIVPIATQADKVADSINQILADLGSISILDISFKTEERQGVFRAQVIISYDSAQGSAYNAIQFTDGDTTADAQLAAYFIATPSVDLFRSWFISPTQARFTQPARILVLCQDREQQGNVTFPHQMGVQSAQALAAAGTGDAKHLSTVSFHPQQLTVRNLGGQVWNAQTRAIAVGDNSGALAGINCCGTAGTPDPGEIPGPITAPTFDALEQFDPIPGQVANNPSNVSNCCLRFSHTCQCIGGIDTWVATSIDCVNNGLCQDALIYCDEATAYTEVKNGCRCGEPVPTTVPVPTCTPECCAAPGPVVDCCLHVIFTLTPAIDPAGNAIDTWEATTVTCVPNAGCTQYQYYDAQDTDSDGVIDLVEYYEKGACACGTTDEDTLLSLLPTTYFSPTYDYSPLPMITCARTDCVYTWESEWDCGLSAWGTPALLTNTCVLTGTAVAADWAYDGTLGRECFALRTTVQTNCDCRTDADCL
jgi:hypothetical protein